jgi:hypothetical protein
MTLVFAVVLSGGTWWICNNSHFDVFPCEMRTQVGDRFENRSGTCALLWTQPGYASPGERYEITGAGYAVEVLVIGIAPMIAALLLGSLFKKKNKSKTDERAILSAT